MLEFVYKVKENELSSIYWTKFMFGLNKTNTKKENKKTNKTKTNKNKKG
jgi:hypothetical protein